MQNYQPMNPTREEAPFQLALSKSAAKRAAWLDGECEGAAALRQRLDALLAAHDQPETMLTTQAEAARPTLKLDLDEPIPRKSIYLRWRCRNLLINPARQPARRQPTVSSAFRSADLGTVSATIRSSNVANTPPRRMARPSK